MYNPSIHTASNKPYGVTGIPDGARYWYYDTSTFIYRPYANTAEVLGYLIGDDRIGVTVQVGMLEYWFVGGILDADLIIKNDLSQFYTIAQMDAIIASVNNIVAGLQNDVALLIENNTGINTGDETQATIITKIGYTPFDASLATEPFSEVITFTYDGTNNVRSLSFTPKQIDLVWFVNQSPLNPFGDYFFTDNTITIDPDILTVGIEYTTNIKYYK